MDYYDCCSCLFASLIQKNIIKFYNKLQWSVLFSLLYPLSRLFIASFPYFSDNGNYFCREFIASLLQFEDAPEVAALINILLLFVSFLIDICLAI